MDNIETSILDYFRSIMKSNNINSNNTFLNMDSTLIDNINDEDEHKKFISNTFDEFYKQGILNNSMFDLNKMSRVVHTNSVFLLGLLFYKNIENDSLHNTSLDNHERQFQLIWFLTSVVHDFLFDMENKKDDKQFKEVNENINSLENYFQITNNLIKTNYFNELVDENTLPKLLKIIPNYYAYRYKHSNKIDHGISAGIVLFDKLVCYRRMKRKKSLSISKYNKYWKEDLDKSYAKASLSIAAHNIWAANNQETKEIYKKYNLNSLIEDNIFPIKFKDMPYLFLLGLIDTIEPTKTFNCISTKYVLQNLLISFEHKDTIVIKNSSKSELNFSKLKDKVNGLDKWLDVKIDISDTIITIKINLD